MAIFYFQKRKLLAPFHEKGKFIKRNNISIGSEIVGFLDFYGNKMDFNKYAICVKTGRLIMKADCKFNVNMSKYNFNMCIIDPVVNNFNVTKSVTAETLRQIVNVFQECHKKIIGGDLSGFR
ncbi:hypothetical protein EDEG_00734 [Edhazardia aedis USNM 41457]|uniref:PAP-associated domain-containing protein n=1 Tax=Edhazardia aedis (strain USNM 41457) TaxID=1003232 RepID=J9DBS5_EDHAE|nr:hypothetical protein EDEG_00734 [Edhazardia aedis USNM 41457]|eukprot:EJW05176.1 hypothetical protein EDEG_00734 [Edhazardia aedis USNM 41457]